MRSARGLIGPLVACLAAWAAARALVDVVEVRGRSMLPALEPGDRLVVVRRIGHLRPGMLVLAPDPREPSRELIKRVASVGSAGVRVAGDNPSESTDARTFGAIPIASVSWRVVARYWPPDRIGRINGVSSG